MPTKSQIPFGPDVLAFYYKDRWIWITPVQQKYHSPIRKVWRAKIERYRGDIIYSRGKYTQSRWQFAEMVLNFVDGLIRREKERKQ